MTRQQRFDVRVAPEVVSALGSRGIAVGALVRKDSRKLRMSRLRRIERQVHR